MKERFKGVSGKRRLLEIIRKSPLISGQTDVSAKFLENGGIFEYQKDEYLIKQDDHDDDLLLIISGETKIYVNGRLVATRKAPNHIGEMSLINPKERRSADVIAASETLIFRISEEQFSEIASEHPFLWRNIAIELADRLKQRGRLLETPNQIPNIFIASSAENLFLARELQQAFSFDSFEVDIWTDQVFQPSSYTLPDLISKLKKTDFAIFLLLPEDITLSRNDSTPSPRDNIIFELGLFIGRLGNERTFLVGTRNDRNIKIPSDILGIKMLLFDSSKSNLSATLGPVCNEIRKVITRLGPI